MCFRPAAAASSIKCPKCGFDNPSITDTCLECDADLTETKAQAAGAAATVANGAPIAGGPSAPAAPKAPQAPKAPLA